MMPNFHWPKTSIHEFTWNSKSCPEGLPKKRNGRITANEAAITTSRGRSEMGPPTEFVPTSSRFVTLCSKEDEFGRELPPGIQMGHKDCGLSRANGQCGIRDCGKYDWDFTGN